MDKGEMERIVREFFDEAISRQDVEALDRYCSERYLWHAAEHRSEQLEDVSGLPAFKELCRTFFRAFPDFETELLDVVVGEDRVVARYVEGGTFAAEFLGYPPSGTKVTWPGIGIYRIEDGRIAEEWFQSVLEERVRAASESAGSRSS